jgi:hypothetical protein
MNTKKILNLSAAVILIAGAILKILHLPGAGPALILSSVLIIAIIFIYAIKENKEGGIPNLTNYLLTNTLAIAVLGALFTGMHWPGGYFIVIISVFLNIIATLYLIITKEPLKISKQYIISVFLYICLLSSFIAVKVGKNLLNIAS